MTPRPTMGMAAAAGALLLAAATVTATVTATATATAATKGERAWSADGKGARVTLSFERQGRGEALVLTVTPRPGVRIEPPVVRIDAPALVRRHIAMRFPATLRADGTRGGAIRAALPLDAPGAVRVAGPDSNDGELRVEYRACGADRKSCAVERADIPLRAAP